MGGDGEGKRILAVAARRCAAFSKHLPEQGENIPNGKTASRGFTPKLRLASLFAIPFRSLLIASQEVVEAMRCLEQAQQQKYKEWESTNEELRAKLSEAKKVDTDELNARIKALEEEVRTGLAKKHQGSISAKGPSSPSSPFRPSSWLSKGSIWMIKTSWTRRRRKSNMLMKTMLPRWTL